MTISGIPAAAEPASNYRWVICGLLFVITTINYMDRNLLGVLKEKTKGNLTDAETRTLDSVLYEVRMAFLELTSMISVQAMQPPQGPPPGKR